MTEDESMKGTGVGSKVLLLNLMVVAMKECVRAYISFVWGFFVSVFYFIIKIYKQQQGKVW